MIPKDPKSPSEKAKETQAKTTSFNQGINKRNTSSTSITKSLNSKNRDIIKRLPQLMVIFLKYIHQFTTKEQELIHQLQKSIQTSLKNDIKAKKILKGLTPEQHLNAQANTKEDQFLDTDITVFLRIQKELEDLADDEEKK